MSLSQGYTAPCHDAPRRVIKGLAFSQDSQSTELEQFDKPPSDMRCEGGCGRYIKRTHLYPTISGVGWQGSVGCHCLDCFAEKWDVLDSKDTKAAPIIVEKLTENQWSSKCKDKWADRLEIAGQYKNMSRIRSWKEACDDIDKDPTLQGLSNRQKKTHLKALAKHHMEVMEAAFLDMNEKEKEHVIEG
jgi:hypothetical protein